MLWILSILRFIRRLKKRVFGAHPAHWANDLLFVAKGPIKILEELAELLPTASAIMITPRHFFERLPSTIQTKHEGGDNLYKTPIGFACQVVFLLLAALGITHHTLELSEIRFHVIAVSWLLISIAITPIVVPIICAALVPPYALFRFLISTSSVSRYEFRRAGLWLRVPLAVSSYRNLNWSHYFWGLFYYFGYLISVASWMSLLLVVLVVLGWRLINSFMVFMHWQHDTPIYVRLYSLLFVVALTCLARIVFFPYMALLIATNRRSTPLMRSIEYFELEEAAYYLIESAKQLKSKYVNRLVLRFSTELRRSKAYYLRKRVIHKQNSLTFQDELSNIPWDTVLDVLVQSFLSYSLREEMEDLLSSLDSEHLISKRFHQRCVQEETSRVHNLINAFSVILAFAREIGKESPLIDEHYRNLVDDVLTKRIPYWWSNLNPSWDSLRVAVQKSRLDRVQESVKQMGFNWDDYALSRDVLAYLLLLKNPNDTGSL